MNEKILCVDDDPEVLAAYQRALRKDFEIDVECGGESALGVLAAQGPYAVIVADLLMPGMDGIRFLAEARKTAPHSVPILLTGGGDRAAVISAINEGHVFHFLSKPCPPEVLARALSSAILQHRAAAAEKELLRKTMGASIKLLTDLLSLARPAAFERGKRVLRVARDVAAELGVAADGQIDVAAMLSHLGCIAMPEEIVRKAVGGHPLSQKEAAVFEAHSRIARDLIGSIPRLDGIASIVAYQDKRYDGSGVPDDDVRGEDIPLEARILKVALDFDAALAGSGAAPSFTALRRRDGWYDPSVLDALLTTLTKQSVYEVRSVSVTELTSDMLLAETIGSGAVALRRGQEMTPPFRVRLKNVLEPQSAPPRLQVLVPAERREAAAGAPRRG